MSTGAYLVLRGAFLICSLITVTAAFAEKDRLLKSLLQNYEKRVEPPAERVVVEVNVALLCSEMDKSRGHVVSNVWESFSWEDNRLRWLKDRFDDHSTLHIPAEDIWTPDVREFNSVTAVVERDRVNAVVSDNGTVRWSPRATYRTICSTEGASIVCNWRLRLWTYNGFEVGFITRDGDRGFDLDSYNDACPLVVSNYTTATAIRYYACCEEPTQSLEITIVLEPRLKTDRQLCSAGHQGVPVDRWLLLTILSALLSVHSVHLKRD